MSRVRACVRLNAQAVLCHLRSKPPNWKTAKKTLEEQFSARKGKKDRERYQVLHSALESAQKKEMPKLQQILAKYPVAAMHDHLRGSPSLTGPHLTALPASCPGPQGICPV
jgi:hypothetical protein